MVPDNQDKLAEDLPPRTAPLVAGQRARAGGLDPSRTQAALELFFIIGVLVVITAAVMLVTSWWL